MSIEDGIGFDSFAVSRERLPEGLEWSNNISFIIRKGEVEPELAENMTRRFAQFKQKFNLDTVIDFSKNSATIILKNSDGSEYGRYADENLIHAFYVLEIETAKLFFPDQITESN
jgi:hypothetical protein